MNFIEAARHMEQGGKVRHPKYNWVEWFESDDDDEIWAYIDVPSEFNFPSYRRTLFAPTIADILDERWESYDPEREEAK